MTELTPREIVAELDKHIVGQPDAKRAVAVAVRNRWRRRQLAPEVAREIVPHNILMIGPTGVGKTEIARRLARLVKAPFLKVEATRYTEVGYHGRDVDTIIRDLVEVSLALVRSEMEEEVRPLVEKAVEERILDLLLPIEPGGSDPEAVQRRDRSREKIRQKLRTGLMEEQEVELSVEKRAGASGMLASLGVDMEAQMQGVLESVLPARRESRKMTLRTARGILFQQEADKLLDRDRIASLAVERAEQTGIVFIDELDKVAAVGPSNGPDVSRQGVQRDLLPIVEGCTLTTRYGPVRTDHILFIAAGAFHVAKPSDLIPELQGRFPVRVELSDLTEDDFVRILTSTQGSPLGQQKAVLGVDGGEIEFAPDGIREMARLAYQVNRKMQNIGARRLHTVVERVCERAAYDLPEEGRGRMVVDRAAVQACLADLVADEDLAKYIL